MKRYKLLKDLPFAKAGEIFDDQYEDGILTFYHQNRTIDIYKTDIENCEEWFEEVRTFGGYYYVIDVGHVGYLEDESYRPNDTLGRMEIGNIFKTKEEAEKYLEYLKAKTVIEQDVKGIEIDWKDLDRFKYYGMWNIEDDEFSIHTTISVRQSTFYFNSREEVEASYEKHPEEWKTYLTYGQ